MLLTSILILTVIVILLIIIWAYYHFSKKPNLNTVISIIALYVTISGTIFSSLISIKSYQESTKVSLSQIKPLIQIMPIDLKEEENSGNKEIHFKILNYSEFDALNVAIDINFNKHGWIKEKLSAIDDSNTINVKKLIEEGKITSYSVTKPNKSTDEILESVKHLFLIGYDNNIQNLHAGSAKILAFGNFYLRYRKLDSGGTIILGDLKLGEDWDSDLEKVCHGEDLIIQTKVTWENNIGKIFNKIEEFRVICTTAGQGKSYNFIPYGIVEKDDF